MTPADVLDEPCVFLFAGHELAVSGRPFETELQFQRWLETEAIRFVTSHRKDMNPSDYTLMLDGLRRDGSSGMYEFGGLASWQAQHSAKGFAELAWLDLVRLNPVVTRELVECILADPEKKAELRELLDRVNDPNRRAGARAAAVPA